LKLQVDLQTHRVGLDIKFIHSQVLALSQYQVTLLIKPLKYLLSVAVVQVEKVVEEQVL